MRPRASTTEVAASVRQVSATSKDLAGTMNEVSQTASHAADLATKGRDNRVGRRTDTAKLNGRVYTPATLADHVVAPVTTGVRYPYTADGVWPGAPTGECMDTLTILALKAGQTTGLRLPPAAAPFLGAGSSTAPAPSQAQPGEFR